MSATLAAVNNVLGNPALQEYLAIVKGARNGLVYGVKVRFPHALIMSILFGRGTVQDRLRAIFLATRTHAFNLAKFVAVYKTVLLLQRKTNAGKERSLDTFVAGLLGGYLVFGTRTAINEQIVLYVTSRVIASFLPRDERYLSASAGSGKPVPPDKWYFTVFAAATWGAVMWLFRHRQETIQPGMHSSMTYLYRDSETWKDLRTFLWHNK